MTGKGMGERHRAVAGPKLHIWQAAEGQLTLAHIHWQPSMPQHPQQLSLMQKAHLQQTGSNQAGSFWQLQLPLAGFR